MSPTKIKWPKHSILDWPKEHFNYLNIKLIFYKKGGHDQHVEGARSMFVFREEYHQRKQR
jgi:hypothetical protein